MPGPDGPFAKLSEQNESVLSKPGEAVQISSIDSLKVYIIQPLDMCMDH